VAHGLLFALMGLEALFLVRQSELRRTFSSHVDPLLGLTGSGPGGVRGNVGVAHHLRNQ